MNQPLRLYRRLLRAARLMPTDNRKQLVLRRSRLEFEDSRQCSAEEAAFLLQLGEVQLDNAVIQAEHLRQLQQSGHLKL